MVRAPEIAAALTACAVLFGCGGVEPLPYAVVQNGGQGPTTAGCEDVSLSLAPDGVRTLAAAGPGCTPSPDGIGSPVAAAYAYVQTQASAHLAGPVIADPVEVRLLPSAMTGSDGRGLAAGADQRALDTGADQRALDTGAGQRALDTGADQRALDTGADQRALDTGADQRALDTGADQRALDTGADQRALAAGANQIPALALRKTVSRDALHAGGEATFALTFVNGGTTLLERLVLVDRVDPWLRVTDAPGARAYVLEDQSTLLVWDDRSPLPPGSTRQYLVRFVARGQDDPPPGR